METQDIDVDNKMESEGMDVDDNMETRNKDVDENMGRCFSCTNKMESQLFDHPLFKGKICIKCKECLKQSLYAIDVDSCYMYCVVCGNGGKLCVCGNKKCGRVYCFDCIIIHTDNETLEKIKSDDYWKCFLCARYNRSSHGALIAHEDWSLELVKFSQAGNLPISTDLRYLKSRHQRKIRVLSLFDGIGTGKVALDELGLDVDVYYASEIDTNALLVSNFHHGSKQLGNAVRLNTKTLKEICPIDLVLGGPPCNDLSIVNPDRKGFDGTGKLVWCFESILRDIETLCVGKNHVFWLMESTGSMVQEYKEAINKKFGMEPARWDSKYFTGQRRARNFWGNIPGMFTQPESYKKFEMEIKELDSAMIKNCERVARISHSRTITTSSNSLTETNGVNNHIVLMNGKPDAIWVQEIERLFGFPIHYTDVGTLSLNERRALLGKSWSVPVIMQILSPLKSYFVVKKKSK